MNDALTVSRPYAPGYFDASVEGEGLMTWEVALEQLAAARNYWLVSASRSGVPHSMPVWGVWLENQFLFSTSMSTRKARNVSENPRVVVHLESGAQLVVVEGVVSVVSNEDRIADFLAVYNPKYSWKFSAEEFASGGLFEVHPRKAFAWSGDEGDAFSGSATRWIFDEMTETTPATDEAE